MFGTMTYETERTGFYNFGKSSEQMNRARQKIKELQGKKVICLDDGNKFLSISEAAKYYCISACTIRRSANNHVGVTPKGRKVIYHFMFVEKKEGE